MEKDFQPGSLLLDYFPVLQRLPQSLQPWLKMAKQMRAQEMRLHRAFLRTLQRQIAQGSAPSCFGSLLIHVRVLSYCSRRSWLIILPDTTRGRHKWRACVWYLGHAHRCRSRYYFLILAIFFQSHGAASRSDATCSRGWETISKLIYRVADIEKSLI